MKKLNLFAMTTISLISVVSVTAALSGKINTKLSVNAEETVETIEWTRDGTNLKHNSNNWTVKSTSNSGTPMYAVTNTTFDLSTRETYVCSFTADNDFLTFATDETGTNALRFQYIKTISITNASDNLRKYNIETSTNGTTWTNKGIAEFTKSERSTNLAEGAKYVRISRATANTTSFVDIKVSYICNPNATETPDTPDPGTQEPDTPNLNGTYVYGYYQFILEDGYGHYIYDKYSQELSYELNGENLTFTLLGGDDNSDFGSKRLFNGTETVNSTGVLTPTGFKVSTYNAFGASTTTFTKQ